MTIEEQKKLAIKKVKLLLNDPDRYEHEYTLQHDSNEAEIIGIIEEIRLETVNLRCKRHVRTVVDNIPVDSMVKHGTNMLCPVCQKEAGSTIAMLKLSVERQSEAIKNLERLTG
jgi:hypothetical protein